MQQLFIDEVDKFITFGSQVSSGYCIPNIVKTGQFFTKLLKTEMETFLTHTV